MPYSSASVLEDYAGRGGRHGWIASRNLVLFTRLYTLCEPASRVPASALRNLATSLVQERVARKRPKRASYRTEQANRTLSGIDLAKSSSRAEGPKERRSTAVLSQIAHAPSSLTGNDSCCAPGTRKAGRRWHCPCEDRPLRRSSECDLERRGHLELDGLRSKSLLFVGCTARSRSILGKGAIGKKATET